jgi:hypothetical protein
MLTAAVIVIKLFLFVADSAEKNTLQCLSQASLKRSFHALAASIRQV